ITRIRKEGVVEPGCRSDHVIVRNTIVNRSYSEPAGHAISETAHQDLTENRITFSPVHACDPAAECQLCGLVPVRNRSFHRRVPLGRDRKIYSQMERLAVAGPVEPI